MEFHTVTDRAARLPIVAYAVPMNRMNSIRGCVDHMTRVSESELLIEGWMLHPKAELSSIQVHVNGTHVGAARFRHRQDVAASLSWVPHAARVGFEMRLNPRLVSSAGIHHIDLIGYRPPSRAEKPVGAGRRLVSRFVQDSHGNPFGTPVGRYHTLYRLDLDTVAPSPPPHLRKRVVGHDDLIGFKTGGMKLYADFLNAMAPHRDPNTVHRVLDWGCGCGCGRATVHFLLHHPNSPEVHGCDIDGEAIAWCQANLQPGHFAHIAPLPPLPYPDANFDAIVSCSVFSHLQRDMQHLWLAELRRVLAPDGLVLASFHGTFAASVTYPPEKAALVRRAGTVDDTPDDALGDIVGKGYYKSTFQTQEYTLRERSKHFEILDYIVAGMHNFQDLAVMRKRAA